MPPYGPDPGPQDTRPTQPYHQPPHPQQPPFYPYGYPLDHSKGTVVLVLGVLSIGTCPILGPIAWIMGNGAKREIDENPGVYSNRSAVQAGRICGMIGTAILAIYPLFFVLWIVAVASAHAGR